MIYHIDFSTETVKVRSTGVTGWSCLAKASMGSSQIFLDVVRLFLLSLHLNRE